MGKVAIVTGASRGLGRGIALTLAKEGGYTVYATARNGTALNELSAEASESEQRDEPGRGERSREAKGAEEAMVRWFGRRARAGCRRAARCASTPRARPH